ncbi:MAG: isoprenylcysteine carboxylmethyltransferase family protein [Anaerolineales bacterium]|nr:isoprenylcysteine carboxylmethyltransferase family protein [Anaerolineales bacterium]
MQSGQVFKIAFFALFLALLGIRGFFGWKVRQKGESSWSVDKDAARREGTWSLLLRPLMFLAILVLVGLYALIPSEPAWLVLPLPAGVRAVGAGLGILSLLYLVWVHHTLREFWSTVLQLRQEHALITTGPYRWIRHPMYSVLTACFISLALLSAMWPLLLLTLLTVPFFYRATVKEEEMMIAQFGDEYRAYRERTGRFLPQFGAPVRS